MSLQTAKLKLVEKIISLNQESIIKKINDILDSEMVVGYTVNGKPLTQLEYNQRIAIAEKQIRDGKTIGQADLERESKNW